MVNKPINSIQVYPLTHFEQTSTMHISPASNMQFICMCLTLLVSTALCLVPSVGTFTLNTVPNPGFKGRNGTAAYLKAMAKYAHLADTDGVNKAASPRE